MPKISAKELAARKERARREDKHRQRIEAKIAELEKQGLSTEQICDELELFTVENPLAKQFIFDRLKGVDVANVDDEIHRAMVDLLRSDIPLDPMSRNWIADLFWRFAFPNPPGEARQKRRVQAMVADDLKRFLQERGMSALEAEQQVAKDLGFKTVDALRKHMQRAK